MRTKVRNFISFVKVLNTYTASRWQVCVYIFLFLLVRGSRKSGTGIKRKLTFWVRGIAYPIQVDVSFDTFHTLYTIFYKQEYQTKDQEKARHIIDAGANIGIASIYFAIHCPLAEIVAVEASPETYTQLVKNMAGLPFVTTHLVALGGTDGPVAFHASDRAVSSSLLSRSNTTVRSVFIEGKTLDAYLEGIGWSSVDIMKFDIEGAEKLLFQAWKRTQPISTIVGEVHWDIMDMPREEFLGLLEGYHCLWKEDGTRRGILVCNKESSRPL